MVENLIQIKSGIMINVNGSVKIWIKCHVCKNSMSATYLANIIDDSEIAFDKITEETKLVPKTFNEK